MARLPRPYAIPTHIPLWQTANALPEGWSRAEEEGEAHSESEEVEGRGAISVHEAARGLLLCSALKETLLTMYKELRTDILELCLVEPGDLTLVSGTRDLRRIVRRRPIAIDDNAYYSGKIRYGGFGWRRRHAPANYSAVGANRRTSFSPNLCAVSKQMREEASTILYRQEIILEDTTALHIFLNTIGTFNRRLLADLTIKSWGRCSGKANNYGAFAASKSQRLYDIYVYRVADRHLKWLIA